MGEITDLLMLGAIALFGIGVIFNAKYLLLLPVSMPKNTRWVGVIWMVLLVGLGQWMGRSSSITGVASVDTSAYIQIVSILLGIGAIFIYKGRNWQQNNFIFPFVGLFWFGLVGLITSPVSDVPALSVFKSVSVVVAVIIAVIAVKPLGKNNKPTILFDVVYIYFVFISFMACIGGVFFPEQTHRLSDGSIGYLLEGWPPLNSNSLSYVAAVAFVSSVRRIFISQKINRRLLYIGCCSVGVVTLFMAQGRTSLISSVLAILFLSYSVKEMRFMRFSLTISIIAAFIAVLLMGTVGDWFGSVSEYMQRGHTTEQLSSLSGRTGAWELSWNLFLESPIVGYGFYAAGKTLIAPHNAYFTVLLNGGLLGFMPWIISIIGGMFIICKQLKFKTWSGASDANNYYKEIVAILIVQFTRTVTGQDLTIHSYSLLFFLAALVYYAARKNYGIDLSDRKEGDHKAVIGKDKKFKSVILKK